MQKTISKIIILTAILTTALGVNYLFAVWTGPTQAPPGGNTSMPIHVGATNQVKDGGLSVNALSVFGSEYVQGTIQVGNSSVSPQAGTIRWTGDDLEVYKGSAWVSLTGGETAPVADPNYTDCINAGGSWVDAQSVCYFTGTSCPSGWSKNANYSSTASNTCGAVIEYCVIESCSTGRHIKQNSQIETCQYNNMLPNDWGSCDREGPFTCTATQIEIGCTKN